MIYGVKELSLIDYKKPSYVVFLGGCNFRCLYCHNSSIVNKENIEKEVSELIENLKIRKKLIKAVVISGGEATIHGENLINLARRIKEEGFEIKLDTNGTNPKIVKELIDKKLIDYVAMDIKNIYDKYDQTVGVKVNINNIKTTINLLETGVIDYEFRTTINKSDHSLEDLKTIISYVKDPTKLYFQMYKKSEYQLSDKIFDEYKKEDLINYFKESKVKFR